MEWQRLQVRLPLELENRHAMLRAATSSYMTRHPRVGGAASSKGSASSLSTPSLADWSLATAIAACSLSDEPLELKGRVQLSTEGHSDLRHQVFSLRPVVSCVIQYEPWAILLCSEDLVTCPEMLMHFLKCLFPPPAALLQADEGPPLLVDSSSNEGPPPLVDSSSESVESVSLVSDSDSD